MHVEDLVARCADELGIQLGLPWPELDQDGSAVADVELAAGVALHADQVRDFSDDVTGGRSGCP